MKKLSIIFIILYLNISVFSQTKIEMATYNVVFNSVVGGVGSMIHKKNNETIGHAFINGIWKGSIGGAFTYAGKEITGLVGSKENYWYGLEGKIVHSIGTSITYNASMNYGIFDNYQLNFGPINLHTNFKNLQIRLNPISSVIFVYYLTQNDYKFNLEKTIKTGNPYFEFNAHQFLIENKDFLGKTLNNVILIQDKTITYRHNKFNTISHELIHTLQFEECLNINNFFKIKNYKIFNYISKDIPYNAILSISKLKAVSSDILSMTMRTSTHIPMEVNLDTIAL